MRNAPPCPATTARDRKSTRLNSSHVEISYAVFCLKKTRDSKAAARVTVQGGGARQRARGADGRRRRAHRRSGRVQQQHRARLRRVRCFFLKKRRPPGFSPLPLPAALPI